MGSGRHLILIIALLLATFSVSAYIDDDSYTGHKAGEYVSTIQYADGTIPWEQTGQNIELTDSVGTSLNHTNYSQMITCDADPTIPGKEIYFPADDRLWVYDGSGTYQKDLSWLNPQNIINCADIDNDGYKDVMGIVTQTGTPIYRIYGYESSTMQTKSENNLLGLGGSPYSPINCIEGSEDPESNGFCAFSTATKFQIYEWSTTNMGSVASETLTGTASWAGSTPFFINAIDNLNILPSGYDYFVMFAHDQSFYRFKLDFSGTSTFFDRQEIQHARYIFDATPMGNNNKYSPIDFDATLYGNTTVLYTNDNLAVGDTMLTTVRYYPDFNITQNYSIGVAQIHNPTPYLSMGLWDYDEDSYLDVVFPYVTRSGVQPAATIELKVGIATWDSANNYISSFAASSSINTYVSTFNDNLNAYGGSSWFASHDVDNDGDVELFVNYHYTIDEATSSLGRTTDGAYLNPNSLTPATLSLNASFTSSVNGQRYFSFADANEDGYYDFFYDQFFYPHPDGTVTLPNSNPTFSFTNGTDCSDTTDCSVAETSTVNYTITATDPEGDTIYFAYDCDEDSTTSAFANYATQQSFTCTYNSIGEQTTTVWVDDEQVYTNSKDVLVSVTTEAGSFCDYDGVFEPEQGETEENCAPDFNADEEAEEEETEEQQTREELYEDLITSTTDTELVSVTINEETDEIEASGSLVEVQETFWGLFVRIFAIFPYLLVIVVLLAGISFFASNGGRR